MNAFNSKRIKIGQALFKLCTLKKRKWGSSSKTSNQRTWKCYPIRDRPGYYAKNDLRDYLGNRPF